MSNVLLAISGPSGVGKGTIVNELIKDENIVTSVSCTTRAPRAGEVDGKSYFFLTKEDFLKKIEEDAFLEYDEHFGNYYGTPEAFVKKTLESKSVILEIDVKGAMNAKKRIPETVTILIAPPSKEALVNRLKGRNSETDEEIALRVSRAEYELSFADRYDFVVVNDDLGKAVQEIKDIIEKEKNKK